MKVIILAAGTSSRLGKYTKEKHKCLLPVGGISIIERQLMAFRYAGIDKIVIVKGFAEEKINLDGVTYYINGDYDKTNMVYSLFCAENEIEGELIISYGDILFENCVLQRLMDSSFDIAVAVDTLWEEYYRERYGDPFKEAESLVYDDNYRILEIGESHPTPQKVKGQYIGLIRLSSAGCDTFREVYSKARGIALNSPWLRGRTFQNVYMTDFLQEIINKNNPVYAVPVNHGWLEFDTVDDYERVLKWEREDKLDRFCSLTQ